MHTSPSIPQNLPCVSAVLREIRDAQGTWHTGYMSFATLAATFGTTTADVIRRLEALGVVERNPRGRVEITKDARRLCHGEVIRRRIEGRPRRFDVVLPAGMVLLATNLEATNEPPSEIEKLHHEAGLSMRTIALRLGISAKAVSKHLNSRPPRLTNWPILGTWEDDGAVDDLREAA